MVIDFHTHAFPEKIAYRVIEHLSAVAGGINPCHSGTAESLKANSLNAGVNKAVLLNIATNPKQEKNVNSFAISLLKDDFVIPFGSVHPDSSDIDSELKRLSEAGIKGIKLHPDYQSFFVDEPRMFPIYEKIASYGFITVFHSGVDIGYPIPVHCTPQKLLKALPHFDGAPVIAAHFGGFQLWDDVLRYLAETEIMIDTAFSSGRISRETAEKVLKAVGSERIVFGTDMPWSKTEDEISFISSICSTDAERKNIFYNNAKKILNI